jgi:hypothetical protein
LQPFIPWKTKFWRICTILWTMALRVGFQHLLGMLARGLGQFGPAQHAGNFLGALLAGDEADCGAGAIGGALLFDHVMMVGEGRNLRQVSYAQYLIGSRQCFQLFSYGLSCASADAGIDFVEDKSYVRGWGGPPPPRLVSLATNHGAGVSPQHTRQRAPPGAVR